MSETSTETTAAAGAKTDTSPGRVTNYPVLKGRKILTAVEEYVAAEAAAKAADARKRELRTDIIAAMGGAPVAIAGRHTLNVSTVAPTPEIPDQVVTKQMVGQILRGSPSRSGYQQLRVK